MPRVVIPVEVPPGHHYCLGCKAALPLDRFDIDRRRALPKARCRPCLRVQWAEQSAMRRELARFSRDRIAREAARQAEINAVYVHPTARPKEPEYRGFSDNPYR